MRRKPTQPAPAADDEIHAQTMMEGVRASARNLPWVVMEGESVVYLSHHGERLEALIEWEVEGWHLGDIWHRVIWHGERLVAVIRLDGADPVVIRE